MRHAGWVISIVFAVCAVVAFYHTACERNHFKHEAEKQSAQIKTLSETNQNLSAELREAKELVQKNEIGELKRRWRLW